MTPITNGTRSTRRSIGRINIQPVEKGGRGGGDRLLAGRSLSQSPARPARTKVHLVVDALGLPLEFEVTVGERHDSRPAADLLQRCKSTLVLADKAYDSNELRSRLAAIGGVANIPSNGSRSQQIPYDKDLYKERAAVECTFNLFKQARRFATRYEKTLRNYTAMVLLCCIQCWLRI